tara:strand:- start:6872 stop:7015 length:144 start_codon:yes stop_codon:yes gene_type:complete
VYFLTRLKLKNLENTLIRGFYNKTLDIWYGYRDISAMPVKNKNGREK